MATSTLNLCRSKNRPLALVELRDGERVMVLTGSETRRLLQLTVKHVLISARVRREQTGGQTFTHCVLFAGRSDSTGTRYASRCFWSKEGEREKTCCGQILQIALRETPIFPRKLPRSEAQTERDQREV